MNKQDKHENGAFITTRCVQTFSDLTFESGSFSKLISSGVKNKDPSTTKATGESPDIYTSVAHCHSAMRKGWENWDCPSWGTPLCLPELLKHLSTAQCSQQRHSGGQVLV